MKTIEVRIDEASSSPRNYPVFVGENILESISTLLDLSKYSRVAIVIDPVLEPLVSRITKGSGREIRVIMINGDEASKNVRSVETVWTRFLEEGLDRKSLVINVGGGVIGDMGGFAASTYMRGIPFIQVPTTLLAQVDASVGGKVGIDLNGVKNIIGTFTQPVAVVIDITTLDSLPPRIRRAGFGEVLKHGLIYDRKYWDYVTSKPSDSFTRSELMDLISRSVEIKRDVVAVDEKESGLRKILNFGHTFGHAFETLSLKGDKPLLHGEAISIGMVAEAHLSMSLNLISKESLETIELGLARAGLPVRTSQRWSILKVMEIIRHDKKNIDGKILWTLLSGIGSAVFDQDPNPKLVENALEYVSHDA